jgi:hypothetical protein
VLNTVWKMSLYCLVLILAFDFAFGTIFNPRIPNIYNPYFHHGLKPNFDGSAVWGRSQTDFNTNSLGMRDCCVRKVDAETNRHRIILIGDSFTQGVGVSYQHSFAGIIDSTLKQWFPAQTDVLNAGVVSYSPKFMDMKLAHLMETEGLKFDEVHIFIDISDIANEITYVDWRATKSWSLRWVYFKSREFLLEHSFLFENFLVDHIYVLEQLYKKLFMIAFDGNTQSVKGASQQNTVTGTERPINHVETPDPTSTASWTYNNSSFSEWGKFGVDLAEKNMRRLVSRMKRNGINTTLHVYPWPQQIQNTDFPSKQEEIWRQFAKKHGVSFVTHFPSFSSNRGTAEETIQKYFFEGDVHWNKAGHAVISKLFLEFWCRSNMKFTCPTS